MNSIWTTLGTTTTKFTTIAPLFTLGITCLWYAIFSTFDIAVLGNQWIVYLGSLIYLVSSLCVAAYLALKVINAAVSVTDGWAADYRNSSWLGNGLGLWEAFWALWFLWWSAGITFEGYWISSSIHDEMSKREYAALNEGTFGAPVDVISAIQHFVLLMVLTVVTWITGCALGDNMDELIDWFNKYAQYTDDEAQGNQNERDAAGTAIPWDLGYHTVLIVGVDILYSVMMLGAHWFYSYSGFADFKPVENCDLNDVDASRYDGLVSQIEKLSLGSYDECMNVIATVAKQMDLDGNNYVDRCEDAKFLKGIGNTAEYASTYASSRSLPEVQRLCHWVIIDAFEQPKDVDTDLFTTILELMSDEFPTSLLHHGDNSSNSNVLNPFTLEMRPMSLK